MGRHMNILTKILLVTSSLAASGCATIIEGSSDRVAVSTPQNAPASCQLKNGRGTWSVSAPGATQVKKSKTDLDITCHDNLTGAEGKKTVESEMELWFLGNIVIGGIIGGIIDASTGSMWEYPKEVSVTIPAAVTPAAAPANEISPFIAPAAAPAAAKPVR